MTTERFELEQALHDAVHDGLTVTGHDDTGCWVAAGRETTTILITRRVLDALGVDGPTVDAMARAAEPALFGRPDDEVGPATRSERDRLRRQMRAALAALTARHHITPRADDGGPGSGAAEVVDCVDEAPMMLGRLRACGNGTAGAPS